MSYHIIFAYPLDILRAWDVSVLPASTQTSKQSSRQAQNGSIVHCCWTDSRLVMSVLFPISGPQVTSCIWGADLACALQSKWPAWNPSWTWHGRHGRHDYDPGSGDLPQTKSVLKGAGSKWLAIGAVLPRSPNCLPVRFSIVWPLKKNKVCLRMYRYVAVFYTVLKYFEDGFTRHPTSQWFLFFLSHMFLLALPCPIIKAK